MRKKKIISFIFENLILQYKKNEGLNSSRLKKSWFKKNRHLQIYKEIINQTKFLSKNSTMSERIFCIVNNIKKINFCPFCKEKLSYANFVEGYRRICGKQSCLTLSKKILKDENGLTSNEKTRLAARKNSRIILENGKTVAQFRALKMHKMLKETIDPKTRKSLAQLRVEKSAKTSKETVLSNGLTISQQTAKKSAETMNNRIMSTGETQKEYRIRKARETSSKIGADGLCVYERNFLHGAGRNSSIQYYNSKLYFQGSYEKHFLDVMFKLGFSISRGPRIPYVIKKKKSQYRSDFIINNFVFEIKSTWTYDGCKKDLNKRRLNNTKFRALLNNGYQLIIVFNKEFWYYVSLINNVNRSIIKKENLISFENVISLLKEEK